MKKSQGMEKTNEYKKIEEIKTFKMSVENKTIKWVNEKIIKSHKSELNWNWCEENWRGIFFVELCIFEKLASFYK